ncbi:hypothetical protein EDD18DRAFT_1113875 [Armillaria luteobubalina]|uniref:Uncharacterized protein n=1 Tax=Armillaria luteobubalina TaxID=153913 RepID=A0AA39P9I9_9AGAR|nr:hypothetical protein EDD18DRAFT_1113875 [Armillaria luteobubalina]
MGHKSNRKKCQPAANCLGYCKGSQNHSESPGTPSSALVAKLSHPHPHQIYRGAPQTVRSPTQSQAAAALITLRHRAPMAASAPSLSLQWNFQEGKHIDVNELDNIFTRPSQQDPSHFREEINGHDPCSGFSSGSLDMDENKEKDELESDSTASEEDGDLCFKAPASNIPFEYVESYCPKNPKPVLRMLEERDNFLQLKNKSKSKVKPFMIAIIDTSHGSAKEGKKKAGKDDSRDKPDDSEAQKTALSSLEVEAMKLVETTNHCEQHKGPCLVLDDSLHYHLTMEDISTWAYVALFKVKNKLEAKQGEPTDDLKLYDKIGHKLSQQ